MVKTGPLSYDFCQEKKNVKYWQEFGREKDENHTDLCLHSIVFSFESSHI